MVFLNLPFPQEYYHLLSTIELEPTLEIQRDSGFFNYDYPLLYKTKARLNGYIRLRIEIPEIKKTVIGYGWAPGSPPLISPDPAKSRILGFFEEYPVTVFWGDMSFLYYQTKIRLTYLENTESGSDTCCLDLVRNNGDFALSGPEFLSFIARKIPEKQNIIFRKVIGIDIIKNYGDPNFKKYVTYRDWNFDIAESPYTNLINAYGIMAGIATDTVGGFLPNHKFLDSLANSPLTQKLKFVIW